MTSLITGRFSDSHEISELGKDSLLYIVTFCWSKSIYEFGELCVSLFGLQFTPHLTF